MKVPYVCGPLTELPKDIQTRVKNFYVNIADICHEGLGARAFVPHEHFDPVKHADISPEEIDAAERKQVCENASILIVVAIAPSWGGGIEVEMAHQNDVPVIIMHETGKKISSLLLGNPAVAGRILFSSYEEALSKLRGSMQFLRSEVVRS